MLNVDTIDYRMRGATDDGRLVTSADPLKSCCFHPLGPASDLMLDECWRIETGDVALKARSVVVYGRQVPVPRCTDNAAWFSFSELCSAALGPADYLAVAREFETVFVHNIPELNMTKRDQARRFISLVDALYECKCKLFWTAEELPDQMFQAATDVDALM